MFIPLIGKPFTLRWFDFLVFAASIVLSVLLVDSLFPDFTGLRRSIVFGSILMSLHMTYSYERLRWHYMKTKN
jgi:hypothetical protein